MFGFKINATLSFFLVVSSFTFGQDLDVRRVETTVFFSLNSSSVSPEAQVSLDELFPFESAYYPENFSIIGFADKSGNKDYNMILSEKRAVAVKEYIEENHISNTVFNVTSVGETQPAFACDENLNRCVKITMILKEKEAPSPLARCKELFPEEFLVQPVLATKSLIAQTPEPDPIPEIELEPKVIENNRFQSRVEEAEEMIILDDILFYGNSDRYYKSALPELKELTAFLLANSKYDVSITGHVNGGKNSSRQLRKESKFNDVYDLSLARADAIKLYLIEHGVASERITAIGKGGEELLFPKPTTQAESEANRRIEVTFHTAEN